MILFDQNNKFYVQGGTFSSFISTSGDSGSVTPPESRITFSASDDLAIVGHSFLCFSFGYMGDGRGSQQFPDHWQGNQYINYGEYSTLKQRWDANGPDRTETSYDVLWMTEFTNPENGNWAAPDSPQGIETLQHLYWYALTAQNKGAQAIFLLPPWSPQGMDIDANTMSTFQYFINWLGSKSEITIPVFMIPAPIIVRNWANEYGNVWDDGLHLSHDDPTSPSLNNPWACGAMGIAYKMMMTGQRETDISWSTDMDDAVQVAWDIIQEYECTGFNGETVVTPVSVSEDPLPYPSPIPV